MIIAYIQDGTKLKRAEVTVENQAILDNALWVDLLLPTREEEILAERHLNVEIPSREEMREIELSSRLYKESNALFMTASIIARSDSPKPITDAVTFILMEKRLITIRYIEPQSFAMFISRLSRLGSEEFKPLYILLGLLEATIDRLADILERVGHHLDDASQIIFRPEASNEEIERPDYKYLLRDIGGNGDLGAKARESLLAFNRLVGYLGQVTDSRLDSEVQSRLITITKDINALSDHASFLSSQVNFLLDATLGMVQIEQNNTIKIFSVAAVIFLPPTLIASIYGMNFKYIPELMWDLGYPIAIVLMLISAWLPYKYFKRRKWL